MTRTEDRRDTLVDGLIRQASAGSGGVRPKQNVGWRSYPPPLHTLGDRRLLHGPPDLLSHEPDEWHNVHIDAGRFQCSKVYVSIFMANNGPGITARGQHRIHQEASHASVTVWVRVDIAEEPVAENSAYRGLSLVLQQIE